MNKKNGFAVVRKPSSSVEKAAPGARRVLVGMVADTLTLVRKTKPQPLRVFIVYYEEAPRVLIKRTLQKQFESVTIREFERGDEAWQELSRTTPDLLIMIDVMPGMLGEEIVRRLADKKATCPIIVLSGWGDRSEPWVRDFSNRGLNVSLLQIPFDKLTFLKVVETALKARHIADAPALANLTRNEDAEAIYQEFRTNHALNKFDSARRLLRKAAEMGHAKAMYDCGTDYMSGDGFPQDNIQAIYWIRKAAKQGHADAQWMLGVLFQKDIPGSPDDLQDLPEAYKWLKLAAEQGHKNGAHSLAKLSSTLASDQLKKGERRYREF